MRTRQAHRAQRAELIIRKAFGIRRGSSPHEPVRFELLGDSVAVAVVRVTRSAETVVIRVARLLPDGRVKRMLKECRTGFGSPREQIRYFETLYARYGGPDGREVQ